MELADPYQEEDPYQFGITVKSYNPADERYKHMLFLVAYDIREPRRLRRVAKVCEDFGIRVEYSVFECDLPEERFRELWRSLESEIDSEDDALLAYRICASCVRRIESMGSVVRPGRPLLYML